MKRRTLVILASTMVVLFLIVPSVYGFFAFDAIRRLKVHSPNLAVSREGWTIYVSLSFIVENPTSTPLPTIGLISKAYLNNHVLFYAEQSNFGNLGAKESVTITLTTAINLNLFSDLFWTLVDYLSGQPVEYLLRFAFFVSFIVDLTIFDYKLEGTFELY